MSLKNYTKKELAALKNLIQGILNMSTENEKAKESVRIAGRVSQRQDTLSVRSVLESKELKPKIIENGKQVKILNCSHNAVPKGTYGIVESYLPNWDGYSVNVKGMIVFVDANQIDDDPQLSLNV